MVASSSDYLHAAWRVFCKVMDAYHDHHRTDHHLPTHPALLGSLITRQHDYTSGAPFLLAQLVEQEGHLAAWDAWEAALEWIAAVYLQSDEGDDKAIT